LFALQDAESIESINFCQEFNKHRGGDVVWY
jgi:hypothetical protein